MNKPLKKRITLEELMDESGVSVRERKRIMQELRGLTDKTVTGKCVSVLGLFSLINRDAYKSEKYGYKGLENLE